MSYCETSNRPVLEAIRLLVLENDRLRVTVCPTLGGKITSLVHKASGKEVLYVPDVIRFTRILPRFYFVAGGIEVSFPISALADAERSGALSNVDIARTGAPTSHAVSASCGSGCVVRRILARPAGRLPHRARGHAQPGRLLHPWMSWSNAAIPSAPDTEYAFPRRQGAVSLLTHHHDRLEDAGSEARGRHQEMTGYFWSSRET